MFLLRADILIRREWISGLRSSLEILLLFRRRVRLPTPKNDVWRCFFELSYLSETVSIGFLWLNGVYTILLHSHSSDNL